MSSYNGGRQGPSNRQNNKHHHRGGKKSTRGRTNKHNNKSHSNKYNNNNNNNNYNNNYHNNFYNNYNDNYTNNYNRTNTPQTHHNIAPPPQQTGLSGMQQPHPFAVQFPPMRTTSAPPTMGVMYPQQQQQPPAKRERRGLDIVDPVTNVPVDLDDESEQDNQETKGPTDNTDNVDHSKDLSEEDKPRSDGSESDEKQTSNAKEQQSINSTGNDSEENVVEPSQKDDTQTSPAPSTSLSEEHHPTERSEPSFNESEEPRPSNSSEGEKNTDQSHQTESEEKETTITPSSITEESPQPRDSEDEKEQDSGENKSDDDDESNQDDEHNSNYGDLEESQVDDSEEDSGEEDKKDTVIRRSREDLLSFKDKNISKQPPPGLQGLEIFQDPSKSRSPARKQTPKRSPKSPGRGGRRGGRGSRRGRRTPSVPVKKEWQLAKSDDEKVLKDARLIINKMTPEKYEKLKAKLLTLELTTAPRLRGAIEIIFELAVNVQNYCEMYASLCRDVSLSTEELGPDVSKHFRTTLITLCQKEFEQGSDVEEQLSEADRKEQEFINKKRMMGNMKFIGELFKHRMLSERIMHTVIESLFKKHNDESMEQLTILLSKIGKPLDHLSRDKMDAYFQKLDLAKDDTDLMFRTRCLIMDVIDLRKADWIPRREEVQAKKIQDIHQEVKQKQTPKSRSSREGGGKSGRSSNRSSPIFKNRPGSSSGRRSGNSTPRSRNRDNRMGSSSGTTWNRSSTASSTSSKSERKSDALSSKNSFGALEDSSYDLRPNSGRTTSPSASPSASPKDTEKKAEAGEVMSADKVKLKSGNLIDEYVKLGDKDEAKITFTELGEANLPAFVKVYLEKVTEAPPSSCRSLFAVVDILGENGVKPEHILKGAREVVNRAITEELYFDVPQLFLNLGAVFGVFTNKQLSSFKTMKETLLDSEQMEDDYIGDMLIGYISHVKSTEATSEQLHNNNINLFEMLNPFSRQFSKKWKILSDNDADLSLEPCLYIYDAIQHDKPNQDIENWLKNISAHKEPWFAYKVSSAIIAADLTIQEESLQNESLQKHSKIIGSLAPSAEHQIQVLRAITLLFRHQRSKPGKGKMMFEACSNIFDSHVFDTFKTNYQDNASKKLVKDIEN